MSKFVAVYNGLMENVITEAELSTAKAVARKAASKWSLVESDDLESSLVLWLFENKATVLRYQDDPDGPIKLLVALRRRANQLCVKDQAERSGTPLDFNARYSTSQIERSLIAMFNMPSVSGARVHPSTGQPIDKFEPFVEDAKAMILDVRSAFIRLEDDSQRLLMMKYQHNYTFRDIALVEGISAPGVRKRIRKFIRLMQQTLNGE
jgi:DNA-directed RNA polymerase specialized sigma24 family protein|tara:strand:- start:4009 stop:4629 length:621 start_codon:yes stop_codon:yes gene_type:complete